MSYFSCDQFLQRQIFVFLLIYTKLVMKQQWIPAHTTMVMKSVHLKFCNGWRASLHCLFFIFLMERIVSGHLHQSHSSFKDVSQMLLLYKVKSLFSVFILLYLSAWSRNKSFFPDTEETTKEWSSVGRTHLLTCVSLNSCLVNQLVSLAYRWCSWFSHSCLSHACKHTYLLGCQI